MNVRWDERIKVLADLSAPVWGERIEPDRLRAFYESQLHRPGRVAIPRRSACHVLSGNTPMAGLQSLWRALLAGVQAHFLKWPSRRLPDLERWVRALPFEMQSTIRWGDDLSAGEWQRHDVVAVYGADRTVSTFQRRLLPWQRLLAFGHRWSIGIVEGGWDLPLLDGAIRDIERFDQLGCLSLQTIFVARHGEAFAEALAERMCEQETGQRSAVPTEAAARISYERHVVQMRAAMGEPLRLWESEGSVAWTVIWDGSDEKRALPGHCFVEVRPLPGDLVSFLGEEGRHLGGVALDGAGAERWLALRPSRFCQFGSLQSPPFDWSQENRPPLDGWVDWVDLEVAGGAAGTYCAT